jgi:TcpE family
MRLPVYTGLLRVERRLYHVNDLVLPQPVAVSTLVTFAVACLAVYVAARALRLPVTLGTLPVYVLPPVVIARAARQPMAEGKSFIEFAWSQLRHLLWEPSALVRLRPDRGPSAVVLHCRVWQPLGADWDRSPNEEVHP